MRILEIEKLFQDESKLDKVFEEIKEDIELVDYYANILKSKIANNPEEAKQALLVLAGVFSNLTTVLAIAESEKSNREVKYYDKTRIEIENANEKFTSASVEKQASAYVANYRRVRNLIQGYLNGCEKQISALQSVLKNEKKTYNATQD